MRLIVDGRYEDSAQRYGRWTSEGLLAPAQLSTVLASYAEELMMAKTWAGNRCVFPYHGVDQHQLLLAVAANGCQLAATGANLAGKLKNSRRHSATHAVIADGSDTCVYVREQQGDGAGHRAGTASGRG
jgi:hypothetical protein